MKTNIRNLALALLCLVSVGAKAQTLRLNDKDYLETRGVNVMVYSNPFSAAFYDEKRSGIDIVHHGVLTVTNGGVRFNPTPEQWDLVPEMRSREINKETGEITVKLYYKEYAFEPELRVRPKDKGFVIDVYLDEAVPEELVGKACFNLEFLPSAYWKHSYMVDGQPHYFPRYAGYDTEAKPLSEKAKQINDLITMDTRGRGEFTSPKPLASGHKFVMAPDDPIHLITVTSETEMQLYDGRILAQNGWFVVHSFLPEGKTGKVLEWYVEPNSVKDWVREPVIGFSQVGYTPSQKKETIIEVDPNDTVLPEVKVFRVREDGTDELVETAQTKLWGYYLRYNYVKADFSSVTEPGIYYLAYGEQKTNCFPIAKDVYSKVWYPTLDVWFPVQMDHMAVKEGYRVWHGVPHLDDAVQAPPVPHFDMFEQMENPVTPFEPFTHVDGFDHGGWFDAGDWDIEAGSHAGVVTNMVQTWEQFRPERDETMIDQQNRYVNIHFADGKPDLLQQIEHGVMPLVNIVEKTGKACRGVSHAALYQYNRLDEPSTITDNVIGTGDERWFFTYVRQNDISSYVSALASASRALKEFNPELSARCLAAAKVIWDDNANAERPVLNNQAAFQMFLTTSDKSYIKDMEKNLVESFNTRRGMMNLSVALQAVPYMSKNYLKKLRPAVEAYKKQLDDLAKNNPYGVSAYGGGWGSTGSVVSQGTTCYYANKYFPDIIGQEEIYKCADFIFGCHPYSNVSFVTGVGVVPKNVNYGNNRADFSFIPGALVPGLLLLQPDFMENKDDWPFFWGQNEATIGGNAGYLLFGNILDSMNK